MRQSCIKEKPILFSGAMIRAILDGSKTQTRRVIKHPIDSDIAGLKTTGNVLWQFHHDANNTGAGLLEIVNIKCPYGAAGSKLWVRETWAHDLGGYIYRADGCWEDNKSITWKPSIHMPKQASRITLEITDIRVERLQDISEEDAIAEGISKDKWFGLITVRRDFQKLWDSINGKKHPWDANPYTWVISFRKLEVKS